MIAFALFMFSTMLWILESGGVPANGNCTWRVAIGCDVVNEGLRWTTSAVLTCDWTHQSDSTTVSIPLVESKDLGADGIWTASSTGVLAEDNSSINTIWRTVGRLLYPLRKGQLRTTHKCIGGGYKPRGSGCVRACSNYLFSQVLLGLYHAYPFMGRHRSGVRSQYKHGYLVVTSSSTNTHSETQK